MIAFLYREEALSPNENFNISKSHIKNTNSNQKNLFPLIKKLKHSKRNSPIALPSMTKPDVSLSYYILAIDDYFL